MTKYQSIANGKIFLYKGETEKGEIKLESEKGNIRYVTKQDLKLFYKVIK